MVETLLYNYNSKLKNQKQVYTLGIKVENHNCHCFTPAGVLFAVVSHSVLIPVKMWSIAVHPATESFTYTSECELS